MERGRNGSGGYADEKRIKTQGIGIILSYKSLITKSLFYIYIFYIRIDLYKFVDKYIYTLSSFRQYNYLIYFFLSLIYKQNVYCYSEHIRAKIFKRNTVFCIKTLCFYPHSPLSVAVYPLCLHTMIKI